MAIGNLNEIYAFSFYEEMPCNRLSYDVGGDNLYDITPGESTRLPKK